MCNMCGAKAYDQYANATYNNAIMNVHATHVSSHHETQTIKQLVKHV